MSFYRVSDEIHQNFREQSNTNLLRCHGKCYLTKHNRHSEITQYICMHYRCSDVHNIRDIIKQ